MMKFSASIIMKRDKLDDFINLKVMNQDSHVLFCVIWKEISMIDNFFT